MKTILIVEDTEINIDLITQLLEDEYSLLFARDGEQGLKMALQNNPDLILMDISLPVGGDDGFIIEVFEFLLKIIHIEGFIVHDQDFGCNVHEFPCRMGMGIVPAISLSTYSIW